jgi:hypothetical protein
MLAQLLVALRAFDCRLVVELLRSLVLEYKPAEGVHDLVWKAQQPAVPAEISGKVTALPPRRARQGSSPS